MADNSTLLSVLANLTNEQKKELSALGITPQKRSDWIHTDRRPTPAQIKTLALVAGVDVVPLMMWLADQGATPAQLELFRRALATATAGIFAVILSGAQNDANAASMRVPAQSDYVSSNAHYAQLAASHGRANSAIVASTKPKLTSACN